MDSNDTVLSLVEEIRSSKALLYERRIDVLVTNLYIFTENYHDLRNLLEIRNDPNKMNALWDVKNRRHLSMLLKEVIRRFHNFLESACSLIDKNRNLIRACYEDTEFFAVYQKQVNSRFKNNPLSGFVEDLRVYNFHYAFPVSQATFIVHPPDELGHNKIDYGFVLSKVSLLQWKNWKKGKRFLNTVDKDIDISKLAEKYHDQVVSFHTWLLDSLHEFHKRDFEWLAEMRRKLRDVAPEEMFADQNDETSELLL